MPRPPRICFDGALYHVTCRGDNRERVFVDEADFQRYLLFLRQYKGQFKFLLHCYCLMPNHVHLVIEPSATATISKIMQCVSTRYTQYFNKRHGRVGHLFQGRFHSRLIEKDTYLLAVSRYIHLNPVKAKLCGKPQEYPWSSYAIYLEKRGDVLHLVDSSLVFSLINVPQGEHARWYREFVESSLIPDAAWDATLHPRGRPKRTKKVPDTFYAKSV